MTNRKPYLYVDESGQDTAGDLFVVSVAVTHLETRDEIAAMLTKIEHDTGKQRTKWMKASRVSRLAYMKSVLSDLPQECLLFYELHRNTKDYTGATVRTIARALTWVVGDDARATILIDALSVKGRREIGAALRRHKARVDVRGVRKDESDAFIRLADALAGFVRDATEGYGEEGRLLKRALEANRLRNLTEGSR
jgi:hypothetical protein